MENPAWAADLDPELLAELIVGRTTGTRARGSGFVIATGVVLTAAHVLDDAATVRVRLGAEATDVAVESWWRDPETDIAVVHLTDGPVVGAAEFGRVPPGAAVLGVQALGFPLWKVRNVDGTVPESDDGAERYRDVCHAVGRAPVLANSRERTLEIVVPAPPDEGRPGVSPWSGMSGAAVWAGGRIVGIVARHYPSDGLARLAAVRLDVVLDRSTPARRAELRERLPSLPEHGVDLTRVSVPGTDGRVPAAYRALLADRAPHRLLDRSEELAELVRFCAGDEFYAWWQAPPWAGKSALLATFALDPPVGVEVIAFLITRRYVGQSDSVAFLEAVHEQLAVLGGEDVSRSGPQIGHVIRLLRINADRAGRAGRRLLLVVDGLDEDTGRDGDADLPSIASLLPSQPIPHLRVLVAARPHPGLPSDVAWDHPLRDTAVRSLSPSEVGQQRKVLAREELDRALRGGEPGPSIIGLVAASGGGLTRDDLAALSGDPPYRIDGILTGVLGRTIAAQPDSDGSGERVHTFAHDDLRAMAVERLGADLGRFRERIHAWAGEFAASGWPDPAPGYLLRAYAAQLVETADRDHLVGLALDRARHDRQLAHTGGDGAARTETEAAIRLLSAATRPDLATVMALVVVRDELATRSGAMPVELPGVWARIGEHARARALSEGMPREEMRSTATAGVAVALIETGHHGAAVALDGHITGAKDRDRVARAWARAGEPARAVAAMAPACSGRVDPGSPGALTGPRPGSAAETYGALVAVVESLVAAGGLELAVRLTARIADEGHRAQATSVIVGSLVGDGQIERAERAADAFLADSWIPIHRAEVVGTLARELAGAGFPDRAERVAALNGRRTVPDTVRTELALGLVRAGRHGRAVQVARSVKERYFDAEGALSLVAAELVAAGRPDLAESTLRWSSFSEKGAAGIAALAEALAAAGDTEGLARIAGTRATRLDLDSPAVSRVVDALVRVGLTEQALEISRTVVGMEDAGFAGRRDRVIPDVLAVLLRTGHADWVEAQVQSARDDDAAPLSVGARPMRRRTLLQHVMRAAMDAERLDIAERAADRARDRATQLTVVAARFAVLGRTSDAERVARTATDLTVSRVGRRSRVTTSVVGELAGTRPDLAVRLADAAVGDRPEAIGGYGLADLASFMVDAGDGDRAIRFAELALTVAGAEQDGSFPDVVSSVRGAVAVVLSRLGHLDRALGCVDDIPQDYERERALSRVGSAQAARGSFERALQIARTGQAGHHADELLGVVIRELVARGDVDAAERVLAEFTAPGHRPRTLRRHLVERLLQVDRIDRAERFVGGIADTAGRAALRALLVEHLVAAGNGDRARDLVRSDGFASFSSEWISAMVAAGEYDAAERTVSATGAPVDVVAHLALALTIAGQEARAAVVADGAETELRRILDRPWSVPAGAGLPARALGTAAAVRFRLGSAVRAAALLERVVARSTHSPDRGWNTAAVLGALVAGCDPVLDRAVREQVGRLADAVAEEGANTRQSTSYALDDSGDRLRGEAVRALVVCGLLDHAKAIVERGRQPTYSSDMRRFVRLAVVTLVERGHLDLAESAARELADRWDRARLLADVARARLASGDGADRVPRIAVELLTELPYPGVAVALVAEIAPQELVRFATGTFERQGSAGR